MLIVRGNETPPTQARNGVLAIGNFDGVHRGHQALIRKTREVASGLQTRAGAIVFEPHPREFFAPDVPHFRLTPLPEKLRLFALYGLDVAIVLEFSDALAQLSAQQFIDTVLVERLGVAHVVVGYDFLFGKDRTGSVATLQAAGRAQGFGVSVVAAQSCNDFKTGGERGGDEVFASSRIRQDLMTGDVVHAAQDMGHWWRVSGTVVAGANIGTGIGFPTANLGMPAGTDLKHGIYAVRVYSGQGRFEGAAYFGTRPTVDGGAPGLEVTIFEFDGDLYGSELAVEFIAFVRDDRSFASMDDLKTQIEADCAGARKLLARAGETPRRGSGERDAEFAPSRSRNE